MNAISALPVDELKAQLRQEMQARRNVFAAQHPEAAEQLAALFLGRVKIPTAACVALYQALPEEISLQPLMLALAAHGCKLALPALAGKTLPLTFRLYHPGDYLQQGVWNIQEPCPDQPVVVPDILLVPLLAFDHSGNRLGYGGGYYDRTLCDLRRSKTVYAVGAAYECQEVAAVPTAPHDQKLDAIVTDSGFHQITLMEP